MRIRKIDKKSRQVIEINGTPVKGVQSFGVLYGVTRYLLEYPVLQFVPKHSYKITDTMWKIYSHADVVFDLANDKVLKDRYGVRTIGTEYPKDTAVYRTLNPTKEDELLQILYSRGLKP